MSPDEIAAALEGDDEIEEAHEEVAQEGQSAVPDAADSVNTHFIAFSAVDGHLYELDGRKFGPVNHGATSRDTLLQDAVGVIKGFMARDPEELRFTIVALTAAAAE